MTLTSPLKAEAPLETVKPIPTTVKGMISYYAEKYNTSERELLAVANCESSYNPKARGDGGRAANIFQYHKPTFDRFSKEMGETLNYDSAHDQAKLTSWVWKNKPQYKRQWTCATKLKYTS